MLVEYWAWFYLENNVQEEVEDDDFDIEKIKAEMADPEKWQVE